MLPIHVTVNCYNIPNNTEVFTEGYKILRVGIPQLASAVGGAKSDIYTLLGILNVFCHANHIFYQEEQTTNKSVLSKQSSTAHSLKLGRFLNYREHCPLTRAGEGSTAERYPAVPPRGHRKEM